MDAPRDIAMSTVCSSAPVLAGSVGLGGRVQPIDVDRASGELHWRAGASQPSRSFERIFCLYNYRPFVRRVSAHARLLTRFFLSEIIYKF